MIFKNKLALMAAEKSYLVTEINKSKAVISEVVSKTFGNGLTVEEIVLTPEARGKRWLYDVNLSDESSIILKFQADLSLSMGSEVEGMKFAKKHEIRAPELYAHGQAFSKAFKFPFIFMEKIKSIPLSDKFYLPPKELSQTETNDLYQELISRYDAAYNLLGQVHIPSGRLTAPDISLISRYLDAAAGNLNDSECDDKIKKNIYSVLERLSNYTAQKLAFSKPVKGHFLHGDSVSSNILHSKEGANLIDWEYFGSGDIANEWGRFLSENSYSFNHIDLMTERFENIAIAKEPYCNSIGDSKFRDRLGFYFVLTQATTLSADLVFDTKQRELNSDSLLQQANKFLRD